MARRYDHLRDKALELRTQHNMTLEDIVERLALPKTTIYYWIKDLPIPRTEKQSDAQIARAAQVKHKYALFREAAYQEGVAQALDLLKDPTFRDFVVCIWRRVQNVIETNWALSILMRLWSNLRIVG